MSIQSVNGTATNGRHVSRPMPERGEYPKRPPFFALKAFRLMMLDCLANEIGPEACYLIGVIAHTEDAKGYRGPVTYFNDQLMRVCGFSSRSAFSRAREKAVAAGWLRYEPGAKGKAGRYWVTVPPHLCGINDAPSNACTTEFGPSDSCSLSSGDPSRNRGGIRAGTGEESEHHSSLPLDLSQEAPQPPKGGSVRNSCAGKPGSTADLSGVVIPPALNTPAFKTAWAEWTQYLHEKRRRVTPTSAHKQLARLAGMGADRAVAAINHSIAQGYHGICEPKVAARAESPAPAPRPTPAEILERNRREARGEL